MDITQSSTSFDLRTPRSSPPLLDPSVNEQLRPRRKRRLTAPAELQLGETVAQGFKKARIARGNPRNEVKIVDEINELIPQLRAMGKDTTPQSGGFHSGLLPFILDDGVLSFYTPTDSPESSDPEHSASLPTSATSTPFFNEFPYGPHHVAPHNVAVLQDVSIWRGSSDGPSHVYTRTLHPRLSLETTFIGKLHTSSMRYGPVHAAITHFPRQFLHAHIPLVARSSMAGTDKSPNSSIVSISSPRRNPVHLLTAVYRRGTLVSSYEVKMEEHRHHHYEATSYSASLPQDLIDGLCDRLDRGDEKDTTSDSSGTDYLEDIAVLRFVQQEDSAMDGEETVLAIVAEFHAVKGPSLPEVILSRLSLEEDSSQELHLSEAFIPTPPPSYEHLAEIESSSKFPRRFGSFGRPIPKLSVAIPPPGMHGVTGIQLCTDSPESSTRPTPQTGIPSNVLPVTPFEQLIHTPLSPPPMPHSGASSRSSYGPTPSDSAYPFTLSSTSSGLVPSPAFGVLDSTSGLGSAPAWLTLARNITPFTPSFFMHPHTAAASNAMSSLTQRAFDADTTESSRRDEYFVQSLASPLPIAPVTPFLSPQDVAEPHGYNPKSS